MFSRRAVKSATIRYNMVSYVLKSCSTTNFEVLPVLDICGRAGVSKVTFFKYFNQKDDILLYYRSLQALSLAIQVSEYNLQGLKGLNKVVNHFVTEYKERPSLVLGSTTKLNIAGSPFKPMRIAPGREAALLP